MSDKRRERLEELWAAYVEPFADPQEYRTNRLAAAHQVLQATGEIAQKANGETRLTALSKGLCVWQLIAAEATSWIEGIVAEQISGAWSEAPPRTALMAFLKFANVVPPLHRDAITPAAIPMSRALVDTLLEALTALDEGEVQPLVTPAASGRHGAPHTWQEARVRAIEWVHFLWGRGQTQNAARTQVAAAMRRVSPETLKSWELRDLKPDVVGDRFSIAKQAGELSKALQADPSLRSAEKSVDARVAKAMIDFDRDDLAKWGQHYHDEFGRRHQGA